MSVSVLSYTVIRAIDTWFCQHMKLQRGGVWWQWWRAPAPPPALVPTKLGTPTNGRRPPVGNVPSHCTMVTTPQPVTASPASPRPRLAMKIRTLTPDTTITIHHDQTRNRRVPGLCPVKCFDTSSSVWCLYRKIPLLGLS